MQAHIHKPPKFEIETFLNPIMAKEDARCRVSTSDSRREVSCLYKCPIGLKTRGIESLLQTQDAKHPSFQRLTSNVQRLIDS
jgi:hypothetical protein